MPDDANAVVVKIIVVEGCDVTLLFRQRVAFVAARFCVEQLLAALHHIVDGGWITGDEMIQLLWRDPGNHRGMAFLVLRDQEVRQEPANRANRRIIRY